MIECFSLCIWSFILKTNIPLPGDFRKERCWNRASYWRPQRIRHSVEGFDVTQTLAKAVFNYSPIIWKSPSKTSFLSTKSFPTSMIDDYGKRGKHGKAIYITLSSHFAMFIRFNFQASLVWCLVIRNKGASRRCCRSLPRRSKRVWTMPRTERRWRIMKTSMNPSISQMFYKDVFMFHRKVKNWGQKHQAKTRWGSPKL